MYTKVQLKIRLSCTMNNHIMFVNFTKRMIGNETRPLLKCEELHRRTINKRKPHHILARYFAATVLQVTHTVILFASFSSYLMNMKGKLMSCENDRPAYS